MWITDAAVSVEGAGIAAAPAPTRRGRGIAAGALGWVRDRLATTPGRLVLISILVVVGAVVFGAIALGAEQSRDSRPSGSWSRRRICTPHCPTRMRRSRRGSCPAGSKPRRTGIDT